MTLLDRTREAAGSFAPEQLIDVLHHLVVDLEFKGARNSLRTPLREALELVETAKHVLQMMVLASYRGVDYHPDASMDLRCISGLKVYRDLMKMAVGALEELEQSP